MVAVNGPSAKNIIPATIEIGGIIVLTATMSFLGLGAQPPSCDWGLMLAEGRQYITYAWWLVTFPGLTIVIAVLGFNLAGDWLRELLDRQLTLDNIQVKIDRGRDLPPVIGQRACLAEVIFNLLENAREAIKIKGQKTGGAVTIKTYSENTRVCLEVSDTGVGIAPHLQDRVFEPFFPPKRPIAPRGWTWPARP